jgi:DNA polymerase-3 subunit chi
MELDRALWQEPERGFIPHVRMPGAVPRVAQRTPIWLAAEPALAGAPRTWVNLGLDARFDATGFDRLIEVVSADPDEADAGRQRWRGYRASGLDVRHHGAA